MTVFHRTIASFLICLLCGLALPLPCLAHGLNIFATANGQSITGSVYSQPGGPLIGIPVRVYDPAGELLITTTTDIEGRFTIEAVHRHDHRLVAETEDGHRAELLVPAAKQSPGIDHGNVPSMEIPGKEVTHLKVSHDKEALTLLIEQALARQLLPLQEQLDRYGRRLRVQDIVSGLGYILGIAGLALYWAARKKLKRNSGRNQL